MLVKRRPLLKMLGATGALAAAGSLPARAQSPKQFNVLAVPVHRDMLTGGPAGNIVAPWEQANNVKIEWLTFAAKDLVDRLLRELSLNTTTIDAAFLFNPWASPNTLNLLEPLDSYMTSDPIDDFRDFFPGPVKTMTRKDSLYGVPVRQNVGGLHYNEVFFEEQGLSGPPKTMEELIDYAKKLTYTRKDGSPVVGMTFPNRQSNYTEFVRGWNADYIDEDYNVRANAPEMIEAVTALRGMYQDGSLPHQFTTLSDNDNINWMQTGRAAMTVTTTARFGPHNDPRVSQFPGKINVANFPIAESMRDKFDVSPQGLSFYSLIIPKNSQNKDLSWSFIKMVASKDATLKEALNGNGPMRSSLYDDPAYQKAVPYGKVEQKALETARVVLPAFNESSQAEDMITQQMEAALLGAKTPKAAMDELADMLKPLMPT